MKVRRKENSARGQCETDSAKREALFLAEIISNRARQRAAGDAAHQGAARRPPNAGRIQMKQLAEITNRATNDDVVIAEQQPAKRGYACGNNQWRS